MAPMARTSRGEPGSNVAALDNLDLDDMFTAGGDALFEGLDLDMANMDDIANNNSNNNATNSTTQAAATLSPSADSHAPRRKTKRKTTAPTFFDDLDDDYTDEPAKKKKRTSKGAATKRGKGKKGAAETTTTPKGGSTKKTKNSKTIPPQGPPNAGAVMTPPAVAAAGQFGGRQKKVLGSKAAKGKGTKAKAIAKSRQSLSSPFSTTPVNAALSTTLEQNKALNYQSLFCGLSPSNTMFYPFLPSLPQEVALKNRKLYTLLERVHSSFVQQLAHGGAGASTPTTPRAEGVTAASEDEPIFKLTQEAFKDDKNAPSSFSAADRVQVIGAAIGAVRKTISLFDKAKLAQDLLAVCALLRRQHDFVKQNNANMERWCRSNYNDEDFSAVYHDGKKKRKGTSSTLALDENGHGDSVLSTFRVPVLKVKIRCTGFKDPKTALVALLPPDLSRVTILKSGTLMSGAGAGAAAVKGVSIHGAGGFGATQAGSTAFDVGYSFQPPHKRRKAVSALLARVAQSLESRRYLAVERGRQAISVQEKRRKDVVDDSDSPAIHTAGMWKYIQESGYFEDTITDADLQERINAIQAMNAPPTNSSVVPFTEVLGSQRDGDDDESVTTRLIGLLVDEGESAGDESEVNEDDDDVDSVDDSVSDDASNDALDLSDLTRDERVQIHLQMIGLGSVQLLYRTPGESERKSSGSLERLSINEKETPMDLNKATDSSESVSQGVPQLVKPEAATPETEQGDSVDAVLDAMVHDLERTNDLILARADFARKLARLRLETPQAATRRKQREAAALARITALLKRNKEAKAKAGKSKSKQDDDLKLPW